MHAECSVVLGWIFAADRLGTALRRAGNLLAVRQDIGVFLPVQLGESHCAAVSLRPVDAAGVESIPANLALLGGAGEWVFDGYEVWRMSLILTLVYAMQSAITPTTSVPTLLSETSQGYEFDCSVWDSKGSKRRIKLRQSGGRGYDYTQPDGQSYVSQTRYEVVPLGDDTGLLKGRTSTWPLLPSSGVGAIMTDEKISGQPGSKVQVLLREASGNRQTITISSNWPVGVVDYIGFCDVRPFAQSPLNENETKAYLAK